MRQLTDRQRAVLRTIVRSISDRGYPPTLREIGAQLGIRSTNGVNDHLKALEKKGYLSRDDQKSRAMVPTARGRRSILGQEAKVLPFPGSHRPTLEDTTVRIPILGSVAAAASLADDNLKLATDGVEDHVHIDRYMLGASGSLYGLRVAGDSMIEDGILDGDFIFVKKQAAAPPGSIVVALLPGPAGAEGTVKRFYPERDRIRYQPANSSMEPIYVSRKDFSEDQIMGVVVGVYRRLR